MDLFDYVKKYGDVTFEEKEFNDVDNIVFCSLSYLDFTNTSINKKKCTLEVIGKQYLRRNFFRDIKKLGIPHKNAYKLLELCIESNRYKDIIVHDYVYSINIEKQFSAMMLRINKNLEYICYEGTDELISGWKEDMELSCLFPIPSQIDAIDYANKHIKIFGPNVIIGGHSKGGNLALVAAMYTKPLKQFRIVKVYNNDGPGLRKHEFESKEYNHIKPKYVHIVPHSSMVGILLRNDIYNVIKSTSNNIMSHAISTWVIDDDKFEEATMSKRSKELEQSIISWLENHSDEEKYRTVRTVFEALENADIHKIIEFSNLPKLIRAIRNIKNIDRESKDVLVDLIRYNFITIKNREE